MAVGDEDLSWLNKELAIGAVVRQVTKLFKARGFWGPSQDARALVGHAAGLDFTGLVTKADERLSTAVLDDIARLVRRRLMHEPVGRILGSRDFMGLDLEVSEATLEPRDDTEIVVESALKVLAASDRPGSVVADLGTGTGAILLAIVKARPDCLGVAVDISEAALATALRNAQRHTLSSRVLPLVGSYASALAPASCDLIVSNPPYIPTAEIDGLEPDVKNFDPRLALDGGQSGLDAYRAIMPQAYLALKSGGALIVEIGSTQRDSVASLAEKAGFVDITGVRDRGERDRVVIGICRRDP